jgi:hypothetical protein
LAVRIRTGFHTAGKPRTMKELASVVAALAWKLAVDSIKRMREAHYEIDVGQTYFDFVCEYMVFLAHSADRIAYAELEGQQREEFLIALVIRIAEIVDDNRAMVLREVAPGECKQHVLDLFNRRSEDYAECGFDETGPDFGFRRVFAAGMQELLPEKDRLWAIDQVMDIESPEAIQALKKTLGGMFHPEAAKSRRSRDGASGD